MSYGELGIYGVGEYGLARYGHLQSGGSVPQTLSLILSREGKQDGTIMLEEGTLAALGQLVDVVTQVVHGFRIAIAGTEQSVRGDGEAVHPALADWPTAPGTLEVVSTDADDDAGDTGARALKAKVWTTSWELVEVETVLDGTTPVVFGAPTDYWHVLEAWVTEAGSSGANEGALKIEHENATNSLLSVAALAGGSECAQIWIPPTHYGLIRGISATVDEVDVLLATRSRVRIYRRDVTFDDPVAGEYLSIASTGVWRPVITVVPTSGAYRSQLETPILLEPGTQIDARAVRLAGDKTVNVQVDFELWLVPKAVLETVAAEKARIAALS